MVVILALYGILVLGGGLIGYFQAQSLPSLICGLVMGSALIAAAIGLSGKSKWGGVLSLILILILDAFFTLRYLKTGKFMPTGMMSLVSLVVLVILVLWLRRNFNRLK